MKPDNIEERIRDAMNGEQTVPRNEVWDGIAARRAAGERVLVPTSWRSWSRVAAIGAIAAAAVLFAVRFSQRAAPEQAQESQPARQVAGGFLQPEALMAQSTSTPVFLPMATSARGIREGSWTHGQMRDSAVSSTYTYSLEHSRYEGNEAWLVISTFREGKEGWSKLDSMWTNPDSMAPLYRVSRTADTRTERTYRKDDILAGTTVNGYTAWRTEPLEDPIGIRGGPLYTVLRMPEVALKLQATPLSATWTGSMPFKGLGMDRKIHTFWVNMVVDGTEEVVVPAGKFDCWRIVLFVGSRPLDGATPTPRQPTVSYWVSRDKQWLVKLGYRGMENHAIELLSGEER